MAVQQDPRRQGLRRAHSEDEEEDHRRGVHLKRGRARTLVACALAALAGACSQPTITSNPTPIPLSLSGGALTSLATVDGAPAAVTAVVDTGTPLTAYDPARAGFAVTQPETAGAREGAFFLFDAQAPPVPRVEINGVQLFTTPLRSLGLDGAQVPIGAVLGGDNLSRSAVAFDYRGTQPTITLVESVVSCQCQLADDCQSVFPFSLLGGQETIQIGTNLYGYPATRVVIDVCLEPEPDPVADQVPCADSTSGPNERYLPRGVDVKLLVASGFPGLAIGSDAYDRLRGSGAAQLALASSTTALHLPDAADDGPNASGLQVAPITLGQSGALRLSALAIVGREAYLGPCAELARSRRQRRCPPGPLCPGEESCLLLNGSACGSIPNANNACSDDANNANTAAVIELQKPLAAMVVPDTAPLMQSINADVRPMQTTIEGVIGTAVLAQLVATIDYPRSRIIARCASDDGCVGYPRYVMGTQSADCELAAPCVPSSAIPKPSGGRCFAP